LLGFGGEARATLSYLERHHRPALIGVADQSSTLSVSPHEQLQIKALHLGEHWLEEVERYDIIIRSPGVSLNVMDAIRVKNPHAIFTTGTALFLEKHRDRVWGITGTKGKSTTSSLLYACLKACGIDAILCGNIGIPALSLIDQNPEIFVMELSSYQLEDCPYSPHGAIFLNLFSEHLDHHHTMNAYFEAKQKIFLNQKLGDRLILPLNNLEIQNAAKDLAADKMYFGSSQAGAWVENDSYLVKDRAGATKVVCSVSATRLRGPGNVQNILAVLTALSSFDLDFVIVAETIKSFAPLAHRLEEVGTFHGVTFVNDSISTVPEATINALVTFGDTVETLILGGFDRGISFSGLAEYLAESCVKVIILFPPSGERIRSTIETHAPGKFTFYTAEQMTSAVELAYTHTAKHATCLLSPASPSFPIFKNFEERGNLFRLAAQRA
jgi:UDP-N-acetylmuramoylalanine--D-glutamate ligase